MNLPLVSSTDKNYEILMVYPTWFMQNNSQLIVACARWFLVSLIYHMEIVL